MRNDELHVTVVICTHNPNIRNLIKVMESVKNSDNRFVFNKLIIDNASKNSDEIKEVALNFNFSYSSELNLGLSRARYSAFSKVQNGLLIFVDDDNYLHEDYISKAFDFWNTNPSVMAFGGQVKSLYSPNSSWKREMLQYLGARDLGKETRVAKTFYAWQAEEPIGAGMCLNPVLVNSLRNMSASEKELFFSLGRRGRNLVSGEDGFICRYLYPEGYVAYVPSLQLQHDIGIQRIKFLYLIRLMFSYGKSDYLLATNLRTKRNIPTSDVYTYKMKDFIFFISKFSINSFLQAFRVLGFIFYNSFGKRSQSRSQSV